MAAPMSAIGELSGLIVLTVSFVGHDPNRTLRALDGGRASAAEYLNAADYRIWPEDCHPMPWRRSPKAPEAP